jgi:hypothetical protein
MQAAIHRCTLIVTATHPLYICSTHRLARLLHAALSPASMHARAAGPCHLVNGRDCDAVYALLLPDGSRTP